MKPIHYKQNIFCALRGFTSRQTSPFQQLLSHCVNNTRITLYANFETFKLNKAKTAGVINFTTTGGVSTWLSSRALQAPTKLIKAETDEL